MARQGATRRHPHRVAASHIRIGTFQFFAARGDEASLRRLADYAIARHYPEAVSAPAPYLALLEGVIARQAALMAQWLLVGFIHGVMNTDNMSISGETIDYGPCAFMDAYNPATVFSSIDQGGRYAYGRQPEIALWDLCRLAECLLPLLSPDEETAVALANEALERFREGFATAHLGGLRRKLGLATAQEGDAALAQDLLRLMAENGADFTLTFRHLCDAAVNPKADTALFSGFADWVPRWRARLDQENLAPDARRASMRRANPTFIPRNHRVEAALEQAIEKDDMSGFETMLAILGAPYDDQPEFVAYAEPPPPSESIYRTFCGT
jgi:serine/tyrosine/threonine adenylyltransferase